MAAPLHRVILVSLLPLGSAAGSLDGALIYNGKTCATVTASTARFRP